MKSLFIMLCVAIYLCSGSHLYAQSHTIKIIELDNVAEYVLIKNTGKTTVHLKGWELHGHGYGKTNVFSYIFEDLQLQPGHVL